MGLSLAMPVIIGEMSTRWVERPNALSTMDATYSDSMADLYRRARVLGYSGMFGWQYFCDPHIDGGCVSHEVLAGGLKCVPIALALPPRSRPAEIVRTRLPRASGEGYPLGRSQPPSCLRLRACAIMSVNALMRTRSLEGSGH